MASLWMAAGLLAAAAAWQPLAPGADTLTVAEGGRTVHLVRFDLQRFRPEVMALGKDRAKTAATLRRDLKAVAVINGGFFDEHARPLGLRIAASKTVVPLRPRVDWGVLLLHAGRAEIVHSRDFKPDPQIEGAIQVGPRLLAASQPLRLKPQVARRSAVAVDRAGRSLTLLVTRDAMDAGRLASLLARLGFFSALLLDGGPSTQMSVTVGSFTLDVPGLYAVPDALIVRSR